MIPWVFIFAQERYEPGVILLQVRNPDVVTLNQNRVIDGSPEFQAILNEYSAITSLKLSHVSARTDGWYLVEFPMDAPLKTIRKGLSVCQDILHVTLNYYGVLSGTPNDTHWQNQWALKKIEMENAWDITKPNSEILVGIMDSGIDYTHEDLIDNIWQNLGEDADCDGHTLEYIEGQWVLDPGDLDGDDDDDFDNNPETFKDDLIGWDFHYNENDPQDEYADYHGTRIAGVIGAKTFNSKGVAGIAGGWQSQAGVRLIGLKMASYFGWDQYRARDAIIYLTKLRQQENIVIANMSFQSDYEDNNLIAFKQAVLDARDAGVIMVAAAGNVQDSGPYDHPDVQKLPAPARWSGVLAIGASKDGEELEDERRSTKSLYDDDAKLLVVSPVDTCDSTGINVYTTYSSPPNSYVNWFHGTSAACPIAVGVVSLMLSVNPSLSYSEISNIFKYTAEKIGSYTYSGYPSRTDEVGYGRINAYQALLMALAYDNKTPNISPTVYNNTRILARGVNNSNYLYEVFYSGTNYNWEIFFRRSTDDGSSWQDPERLSEGEKNYRFPCITVTDDGSYDGVHAVFQRKKDNGKYNVYYRKSTNSGSSWQDSVILSNDISCAYYQSYGPSPVITSITSGSTYKLIAVWVTSGGLRYRICEDGQWGSTSQIDDGSYNSCVWFPSIMGKGSWASLTYDTRFYGVYSRIFSGSTWTGRTKVDKTSTLNDRTSQIAISQTSKTLAVWRGQDWNGWWHICYREGNSSNQWNGQYLEWDHSGSGLHSYLPAVSPVGSSGADVVYYTSDKKVRLRVISFSSPPSDYTYGGYNRYPNITHVLTGTPWIIWTGNQNSSEGPYPLELTQQYLSKAGGMPKIVYHRRAGIEDEESQTGLFIEVGEFEAITKRNERIPIEFVPCDPSEFLELDASNLMEYLSIDPATLPSDAEKLQFYVEVYTASQGDTLEKVETGFKDFDVNFRITDEALGQSYCVNEHFSNAEGSIHFCQKMALDVGHLAGRKVLLKPEVNGLEMVGGKYSCSLGHIWIEQDGKLGKPAVSCSHELLPEKFALLENVPNPFNPATTIRYSVPVESRVTLKVYDLLGREVATLVDDVKPAGHYLVRWEGRDSEGRSVPSGIYIYSLTAGSYSVQKKMTLVR